jgi:glycosyltransferase involved in cell wall biosynthesis
MSRPSSTTAATPFFHAGQISDRPRLLLISYHFPPTRAVGGLRWRKLSRYAADRGWELDVITLHPTCLLASDRDGLRDLPPGTRVYGIEERADWIDRLEHGVWLLKRSLASRLARARSVPAPERQPAGAARPTSIRRDDIRWTPARPRDVLRHFYAWRDHARATRWSTDAARLALRLYDPARHAIVITCGPPHMAHEAGRHVARETGLPLVVDMRDPWSELERLPESVASPLWQWFATTHERRVMRSADLIIANTEPARSALCAAYPDRQSRIRTITNGHDEEPVQPPKERGRFTIAYAGTIYIDRNPRLLFRAAARVVRELGLTPREFGIEFIGNVDRYGNTPLLEMAREEGIADYLTMGSPRPRAEAIEFLARATMLVSLPQDSHMAIPAKVFEYVQFDAWLLALAEAHSATGLLLRDTDADVVAPDDVDGIAAVLRRRYAEYARGVRPSRIGRDERFSRRYQAGLLFDAIAALVQQPAVSRSQPPLPTSV